MSDHPARLSERRGFDDCGRPDAGGATRGAAGRYPPALTGLRGQHDGSFEIAHALAREGRRFPIDGLPIEETYDLVVVGGGISGLAAAWFYRRARPSARILILDNHDDFGGHAKRNEFTPRWPPHHRLWRQPVAAIAEFALQPRRQGPVARSRRGHHPLRDRLRARALSFVGPLAWHFFNREAFGRDVLVTGDPGGSGERHARPATPSRSPSSCRVSDFGGEQGAIVALYSGAPIRWRANRCGKSASS